MDSSPTEVLGRFTFVRCVVFDAVGTLIHPRPSVPAAYHERGRRHGSHLSQQDIAARFSAALARFPYAAHTNEQQERQRWRCIVADVFTDVDATEALFQELWDHFAEPRNWLVYEDVEDTLRELRSRGLALAIGSNFDERLLGIAAQSSLLRTLDKIFVSSQLGYTKRSVEFFRCIERELQLAPNQLLMIGDDESADVEGAARAGWPSLWLNRAGTAGCHASIRSLGELTFYLG